MPIGFGERDELIIQPDGDCLFGVSGVVGNPSLFSLDIYQSNSQLVRGKEYEVGDLDIPKEIVARIVMDVKTLSVVNDRLGIILSLFSGMEYQTKEKESSK